MSMLHMDTSVLSDLCRVCNMIRNNSQLVIPNSAQCLPPSNAVSGNVVTSACRSFALHLLDII